MSEDRSLQDSVQNLIDSPGGQIINDGAQFLRNKAKLLSFLFIISVVAAFSMTKSLVSWLIDDSRLPEDVNIIVTSPIEFILLQFQIAVSFGLVVITVYLILELVRKGSKNAAIRERLAELELKPPRFSLVFVITVMAIVTLGIAGLVYSWNFLKNQV